MNNKIKIEIKHIGQEIVGDIYITKKGTYLCDVNFNPNNLYLHTMTRNDFDGEPNYPISKDYEIVIVNEFNNE